MKPGSKVELLCDVDVQEPGKHQETNIIKGSTGIIKTLWYNRSKKTFDVFVEIKGYIISIELKYLKELKENA